MKKIFDWVFGAFFRTMGRFFFFIGMGCLVAYIISHNDINIQWTDLLGIEMVKAAEIVIPVQPTNYSLYYNTGASSGFNCPNNDYCDDVTKTIYLTSSASVVNDYITLNSIDTTPFDYIEFTFAITQASANYQLGNSGTMANNICTSWQESNGLYTCTQVSAFGQDQWLNNILNNSMFMFKVEYSDLSGVQSVCTVSGNTIVCPTLRHNISKIYINSYLKTSVNAGSDISFNFYLSRRLKPYISNSTAEAIQNQTQQYIQAQENATQQYVQAQENATQQEIESQQICEFIDKNKVEKNNYYLNNNGQETYTQYAWGITSYLPINKNAKIEVVTNASNSSSGYYCFYNINKTLIECKANSTLTVNTILTIPSNTSYVRFSINTSSNQPTLNICQNGNQAMSNYLQDSEVSNSTLSGLLDLQTTTYSFGPFATFLNLPLQWIQVILTSNQSCVDIQLPMPFVDNRYITLPCMTAFWQSLGALGTLVQLCWVAVVGVRIFNGLFMLVVDTTSSSDNIEELYKIRSWEL